MDLRDIIEHNAVILETKKELTYALMDIENGEDPRDRIIKVIGELNEIPYQREETLQSK